MKRVIGGAMLLSLGLALAGCSNGGGALTASCIKEGGTQQACDCMVGKMKSILPGDAFAAMEAAAASGNTDAGSAALSKMAPADQMTMAMKLGTAAMECKVGGPS